MDSHNLLGEFLRARREATTPAQVGLLDSGPRRTPGLRREEVAMLAGVSTDYYVRLEQGRERHPSDQVIDALSAALDLAPEAVTHLHELAHPRPRRHRRPGDTGRAGPELLRLIRSWPYTPALVVNRRMDVLAANPLAAALFEGQEHADNLLRMVFLNPAARDFHADRDRGARVMVAQLRADAGADLDDPHLSDLVRELSRGSPDFRRLWARQDLSPIRHGMTLVCRHDVGDLVLACESFTVDSAPGQRLITLQAEPGSPSEYALTVLGSLHFLTADEEDTGCALWEARR
ncbi:MULTISPECIES: helix-turn-helix transcriptional regulator [unclassified Nonomuraea]